MNARDSRSVLFLLTLLLAGPAAAETPCGPDEAPALQPGRCAETEGEGLLPDYVDPKLIRAALSQAPAEDTATASEAAPSQEAAPAAKASPAAEAAPAAKMAPAQEPAPAAALRLESGWDRIAENGGLKLGAAAAWISAARAFSEYDTETSDWMRDVQPFGEGSRVGSLAPYILVPATGALLLSVAVFEDQPVARARAWRDVEAFFVAEALTIALTDIIKVGVGRERPDLSETVSFPSGHTSLSFSWATFLTKRYGWAVGGPAYAFGVFVAATRLQDGKHYLSDVMIGALVGTAVTYIVTELYDVGVRTLERSDPADAR